ncbi:MAG: hypothetical protein K0Q67_3372 [Cellvibrio sp.]|nr:hypothetical protein [Cellvibrio sp.]
MIEDLKTEKFQEEVFPLELEEVANRRANCTASNTNNPLQNKFTTDNNLVGLACSGGGIRSASFCLGVIQYLITQKLFSKIDYLSTVSGGGYIGSCVSALAKDNPENLNLLTDKNGRNEPDALNHIRNYSEYLRAGGFMNGFRTPILFIEGVLRSILTFFPLIILAVFVTELFLEVIGRFSAGIQFFFPLLVGILPLATGFILRPIFKDKLTWSGRDNADARLVIYTVIALTAIFSIPLLHFLRTVVGYNATALLNEINSFAQANADSIAIAGGLLLLIFIVGYIKLRAKMILITSSLLAPVLLILMYLFFCIQAVNSPFSYDLGESTQPTAGSDHTSDASSFLKDYKQIIAKDPLVFDEQTATEIQSHLVPILNKKYIDTKGCRVTSYDRDNIHFSCPPVNWNDFFTTEKHPQIDIAIANEWSLGFILRQLGGEKLAAALRQPEDKKMLRISQLQLSRGHAEWWIYLMGLAVWLYNFLFISINRFSLHPFYRDRLSRTFLITQKDGKLAPADDLKMSELNGPKSTAPYHIINTTLNLQGSTNPQLRSRRSIPFILTKRFCGSDFTGYCPTSALEAADKSFNFGAAVAISAAAVSPNMGVGTINRLRFLLTLLNLRLNYWLPNPCRFDQENAKYNFRFRPPGLPYLIREAFGFTSERTPYINCSDGGHLENLGVYELLKRQCKTIICIDAEADPTIAFAGLITLQRYAAIDFGINIKLNVASIRPTDGLSASNFSEGTIEYSNGEIGRLLYLKLAFTGREQEYLHYYRQMNPHYPHEATSDQYFEETQFEVYRALGNFVAISAADNINNLLR